MQYKFLTGALTGLTILCTAQQAIQLAQQNPVRQGNEVYPATFMEVRENEQKANAETYSLSDGTILVRRNEVAWRDVAKLSKNSTKNAARAVGSFLKPRAIATVRGLAHTGGGVLDTAKGLILGR